MTPTGSGTGTPVSTSSDLLSLAECKALLKISGTTYDSLMTTHLATAIARTRHDCRRQFTRDTYTEIKDGPGQKRGSEIWVREYPLVSVTSIWDSLDRSYGDRDLVDAEDYVIYSSGKIRRVSGAFQSGVQNLKIIHVGGLETIPEMLKQALAWRVGWLLQHSEPSAGFTMETIGDYSYKRAAGEDLVEREINNWLVAYRRTDRL